MTIELRDYQSDLVAQVGQALRRVRRVLVVLPPGGGKTVIAAFIAQAFARREQSTFFNCHRQELLKQTSGTFTDCGLPHTFIAAGRPMYINSKTQICSIDSLKNRLASLQEPRAVIWDECHHIGAAGWAAIMKAWPNAFHIGLTGTPWRLDGTGLGEYFDEMVLGPTAAELIAMGRLAPYEIYAPSAPDMKGARRQMGDFAKGDAEQRMRTPKIIGDIVTHWRRNAGGLLTVGYAVNVAHSRYMADLFNSAAIPSAHLDGGTDDGERKRVIQAYANGDIKVLWNVGLFGEGFDLSAWVGLPVTIDAAILANPTMSLSKYLQESMRCMRPKSDDSPGIINDHAGNSSRHGFPDDDRVWDLEGRAKGKKAANDNVVQPPLTCLKCFQQVKRADMNKPTCRITMGRHHFRDAEEREIEVGEGELVKMTEAEKQRVRAQRKAEEAEARTLDQLVALGKKRGYQHPVAWANKKFGASAWRRRGTQRSYA